MSKVTLPACDAVQLDQGVQWWYWTGHLFTPTGRRFGFEVCHFAFDTGDMALEKLGLPFMERLGDRIGIEMAHCAVTDLEDDSFHRRVLYSLGMPAAIPDRFELRTREPWSNEITAVGGGGADQLHGQVDDYVFDLTVTNDARRYPPVLHYDGEKHVYPFGGYTYYYSRERMDATGTMQIGGVRMDVTGTVWFDRQYGDLVPAVHHGWQWFAIQLHDGAQVMVFEVTGAPTERMGSVTRDTHTAVYGPADIDLQVLDHWTSPVTGIVYPSLWHLTVCGETYVVRPVMPNQEMNEIWESPKYWEGDCDVSNLAGTVIGYAYAELSNFKKP